MLLLRFLLLLAIAGILVLFTLQNWAVPMQLVFLGIRSPAFPLPLWILGAIAAGILTTLVIIALFGLTGFSARRSVRRSSNRTQASRSSASAYSYTPPSSFAREPDYTPPRTTWQTPSSQTTASTSENDADWEEDASDWFDDSDDDWTQEPSDRPRSESHRTDYEAPRQPQSGSRSGSTYSYSYRDPEGSSRDKSQPPDRSSSSKPDSVVDADYRVIVPPYRNLDDDFDNDRDS